MAKSGFVKDMLKPFLVLVCICLVAAALLGVTHGMTEPIIEQMKLETAQKTREAALPGSKSFTEINCDTEALGITGAYKEDSGLGYVLTAAKKGYGGDVVVTLGLDTYGNIVGILADVSTETQGVGTKVGVKAFLDQYIGSNPESIDGVTGATYSSNALKEGISSIINAFKVVKEAES